MFYRPSRHNGWHKARARLADGSVVDLLRNGEPFAADSLESNWAYHRSSRWKLFFRRLGIWHQLAPLGDPVAIYLRDRWNSGHPESRHAVEVQLLYYERLHDSFGEGFTVRACGSAVTDGEPAWESLFDPFSELTIRPRFFDGGFRHRLQQPIVFFSNQGLYTSRNVDL